jgi:Asp/Glu/hydantoin racemase
MKKAAILHTTPVTLEPLKIIADRLMPDIEIVNILDDSLLKAVIKKGHPDEKVNSRIMYYVKCAEEAECSGLMSACSSIGESVEMCRLLTSMPLLRIDEAMAEIAVGYGSGISVLATVETTLKPTENIINRKAKEQGKEISLVRYLLSDAYKVLAEGDIKRHDDIILGCLERVMDTSDVIVLAQASMARVLTRLPDIKVPVITSPESGMQRFKDVLTK